MTQWLTWWLLTCSYTGRAISQCCKGSQLVHCRELQQFSHFWWHQISEEGSCFSAKCVRCIRRVKNVHWQKNTSQWRKEGLDEEKEVTTSILHKLSRATKVLSHLPTRWLLQLKTGNSTPSFPGYCKTLKRSLWWWQRSGGLAIWHEPLVVLKGEILHHWLHQSLDFSVFMYFTIW